jgi:hypothetical protein
MDMRKLLVPFLASLAFVGGATGRVDEACAAIPCRCRETPGLTYAQKVAAYSSGADAVFLATLVRLDTGAVATSVGLPGQALARVRVERVWKGAVTDTLTMPNGHGSIWNSCEVRLAPGIRYVIFAERSDGMYLTRQCWGTVGGGGVDSTIAALGPGRPPGVR